MKLLAGLVVLAVAATGVVAAPSASAQKQPVIKRTQHLAMLLKSHKVFAALNRRPDSVKTLKPSRPITGGRTVLPIIGRTTTKDGLQWLRIRVPGRPNGSKGWIGRRGTALKKTHWHLVVRTPSRRVLAYFKGHVARSFAAVVGKTSTPTPHGPFFVEESVRMPSGSAGAPFALALSARSDVLQEFEGGPGQIAIHGVANLGGTPGTAVSHGCVRLANRNIRWLADRVGPGVPVDITS